MSPTHDDESEQEMERADVAYGERGPDRAPEQADDEDDGDERSD